MTQANKTKLKKKTATPASQKNGRRDQNTAISSSRLPTLEKSSSTTLSIQQLTQTRSESNTRS